jgi:C4-dicarboxylate transporter DctM subunit
MEIVLLLAALFLLLAIGLPVSGAIGLTSIGYLIINRGLGILIELPTKLYTSNDSSVLIAIPLFVFAGYLMEQGGISRRLIDFVYSLVGRLPGALGTVAIVTCMIFAALTGSAIATIAAVGSIMFPYMVEKGYSKESAAGIICCAGALGPVIPPSIPMVIYGSTMGVSVAKLFLGGIMPGLLLGLVFILINTIYAMKVKIPRSTDKFDLKQTLVYFWRSLGVLFLPFLILGGIYGGFITATEAATLAVVYSLLLTVINRSLSLECFIKAGRKSIVTSGCLLLIINIANLFAYIMSYDNMPKRVAEALSPYMASPGLYMLMLFFFLLILGCFMDSGPAILITAPIIVPIGTNFGIDPVFLGTMFCVILVMGAITPPFGVGLYAMASTSALPFDRVVKGAIPYIVLAFFALLALCYAPGIVLLIQ